VLRQGHPAFQFYIVITGRVRVEVDVIEELIDDAITVETVQYGPGTTFGVSASLSP
jgi:CRP-like cAMP-binding protein